MPLGFYSSLSWENLSSKCHHRFSFTLWLKFACKLFDYFTSVLVQKVETFLQGASVWQASSLLPSLEKAHEPMGRDEGVLSHCQPLFQATAPTPATWWAWTILLVPLWDTPRLWGMNSSVTYIVTSSKILIGLPDTSCETTYIAGSHRHQAVLHFPFLQCPGKLCFENFNSTNHTSTSDRCGNESTELLKTKNLQRKTLCSVFY